MTDKIRNFLVNNLSLWAMASVTLGLAPFAPEPHIWKQLKNIANGRLTEMIDWFDLLMHGLPWLLLLAAIVFKYFIGGKSSSSAK